MVLEPLSMRMLTPCARHPISFIFSLFYSTHLLPFSRAESSSIWTVVGSTAEPSKMDTLAVAAEWVVWRGFLLCIISICAVYANLEELPAQSNNIGCRVDGCVIGG